MLSHRLGRPARLFTVAALATLVAGCGTEVAGTGSSLSATRALTASAKTTEAVATHSPTTYVAGVAPTGTARGALGPAQSNQGRTVSSSDSSSSRSPMKSPDGPAPGRADLTVRRTARGLFLTGRCPAPSKSVAVNLSGLRGTDQSLLVVIAVVAPTGRYATPPQLPYAKGHSSTPFTDAQALCYATASSSSTPPTTIALVASSTLVAIR